MTLRVAVLTSNPLGRPGLVLEAIAALPNIEVVCLIVSDNSGVKRNRARLLRKVFKVGILGALNGIRIRSFYADSEKSDAREVASRLAIPIIIVPKVGDPLVRSTLEHLNVDLGLSLGNPFIPSRTFSAPRFGFVNYHGELLPEYPGAISVIWPLYFGLTTTGFTIHSVVRAIDGGEILYQERYPIRFGNSLKDTIRQTLDYSGRQAPEAFAELLANWEAYWKARRPNQPTQHFTTPTLWQFLRIMRNHRRLAKQARN
jgi:methionyl-tRNA formyltransferase